MTATTTLKPTLMGWGYEGRSVEDLIDAARTWGVTVVVDIRLNPISRRQGFSKRALAARLDESGIEYRHMPALGNPRDNRAGFAETTTQDGRRARDRFRSEVLATEQARADLAELRGLGGAIVLCFEAAERCCHRSLVLAAVRELND